LNNYIEHEYFIQEMEKLIKKTVKKMEFDKHVRAVVDSVGSGVADIKLLDSSQVISNVKIRTGLSVSPTDEVIVLAIRGSLNNLLIDDKI